VSLIEGHHGVGLASKIAEMCLHGIPRGENNSQRLSVAAELGIRHPKLTAILPEMRSSFSGTGYDAVKQKDCRALHA
jgi:transcriptional regulator GlxA family with amidase domain